MRKVVLFSCFVVFAIGVNAQVKFGLKAGLNLANQTYKTSGYNISGDSKIGFQAGVILEAGSQEFVFQPGLLFSQKGLKMSQEGSTLTLTLNYLDVPLNLLYKINVGDDMKVFLMAGPVISFGLSAKGEMNSQDIDVKFGSGDEASFKTMDLGFGIGGGLQMSSFLLGLNYNFGLSNAANSSDVTVKNNVLTFSVGILFGGK